MSSSEITSAIDIAIADANELWQVWSVVQSWGIDHKGLVIGSYNSQAPWMVTNFDAMTPFCDANGLPLSFDSIHELIRWLLNEAPDCRVSSTSPAENRPA